MSQYNQKRSERGEGDMAPRCLYAGLVMILPILACQSVETQPITERPESAPLVAPEVVDETPTTLAASTEFQKAGESTAAVSTAAESTAAESAPVVAPAARSLSAPLPQASVEPSPVAVEPQPKPIRPSSLQLPDKRVSQGVETQKVETVPDMVRRKASSETPVPANPMWVRFTDRKKGKPEAGSLGQPHESVRPDDRLQVYLTFDEPLYFYLLRLDTDGSVALCWPENGATPPTLRDDLAWPTGANAFRADDAGAQGFILVADTERMSSFDVWYDASLTKSWAPCTIEDPIYLDGERYHFLIEERGSQFLRSEIPQPFADVCKNIQVACPEQQVRAICFSVSDS